MSNTPILNIEELPASSSQPEVFVNTATRILEAIIQLSVIDRNLNSPPGSPSDGDRYIVAAGGAGAWLAQDFNIALYLSTGWEFITPRPGWLAYVADEDIYVKYAPGSPTAWNPYP